MAIHKVSQSVEEIAISTSLTAAIIANDRLHSIHMQVYLLIHTCKTLHDLYLMRLTYQPPTRIQSYNLYQYKGCIYYDHNKRLGRWQFRA